MKLLFYADLHFRENGSFIPWNKPVGNGLSIELNNTIIGCQFVAEQIKALYPDLVVNLGDIFHPMESISVSTLYGAHLGLSLISKACKELGIKHYLVNGNHDIYSENNLICSTSILTGYFDEILASEDVVIGQGDIGIVPFHSSPEAVYNGLITITGFLDQDGVLLTHNDFAGAKYENNHETDSNLSPDLPIQIFSGHIHLPQTVGSVIYVGSLVQHRFSQYGLNENGILLYDTETKEVKRFRNNRSKHYVVVKDLDRAREFDPQQVVLKVFSDQSHEEVELILKDYEYAYFPVIEKKDDMQTTVTEFQIEDPLSVLKAFISQENPDALEIFEKVMGKKRK
jgi:DNA repair exonuclease SbcCD nuclease subunit